MKAEDLRDLLKQGQVKFEEDRIQSVLAVGLANLSRVELDALRMRMSRRDCHDSIPNQTQPSISALLSVR